jgi:hypothetical protein
MVLMAHVRPDVRQLFQACRAQPSEVRGLRLRVCRLATRVAKCLILRERQDQIELRVTASVKRSTYSESGWCRVLHQPRPIVSIVAASL